MNNEKQRIGTNGTIGTAALTPTHACACAEEVQGLPYDNDLEFVSDNEVVYEGSDPINPLSTLSQSANIWPEPLQAIINKGQTPAQRDILLFGTLVALGVTLSPQVRTLYAGKWLSPCLMFFAVAPPASGKGVLAWLRNIVQPFQDEIDAAYAAALKCYKIAKLKFDTQGKSRTNIKAEDIPEPPVRKLFIIPGNNSGTGIQSNIIDSGGRGIIFQTEADTLSSALNADYGHFDDALRNFFDHEGIRYYRRTSNELKGIDATFVGVLLSGTPDQVKPLIGSYANGLASRFLWYYCPPVKQWKNQFARKEDMFEWSRQLGQEWKSKVDALKGIAHLTFELSELQVELFNLYMAAIFDRGQNTIGIESISTSIRLAPQMLRIMSIVALLRCLEAAPAGSALPTDYPLLHPDADIPIENVRDGIVPRYTYGINELDFQHCLTMGHTMFQHAMHVLSLLPSVEVTNRGMSDKEALFAAMPDPFTRAFLLDKAEEMGINPNTADVWLKRALKKHLVVKVNRGTYQFTAQMSLDLD